MIMMMMIPVLIIIINELFYYVISCNFLLNPCVLQFPDNRM